jgi:poly(3-hydroxybutyrate) depolymerase
MSLHGQNNTMVQAEGLGFAELGGIDDFITVTPGSSNENVADGIDAGGTWNNELDPTLPNDVDYMVALIQHEEETLPVNAGRVYLTGISGGADMSGITGMLHPELIAGVAASAGAILHNTVTPAAIAQVNAAIGRHVAMPVYNGVGTDDTAFFSIPGINAPSSQPYPILADLSQMAIGFWKLMDDVAPVPSWNDEYPFGQPLQDVQHLTEDGFPVTTGDFGSRNTGDPALMKFTLITGMMHANEPGGATMQWSWLSGFHRLPDGGLVLPNGHVIPAGWS